MAHGAPTKTECVPAYIRFSVLVASPRPTSHHHPHPLSPLTYPKVVGAKRKARGLIWVIVCVHVLWEPSSALGSRLHVQYIRMTVDIMFLSTLQHCSIAQQPGKRKKGVFTGIYQLMSLWDFRLPTICTFLPYRHAVFPVEMLCAYLLQQPCLSSVTAAPPACFTADVWHALCSVRR